MKKVLPIITLICFIVPQITFAIWWNPLSWIKSPKGEVKQEVSKTSTTTISKILDNKSSQPVKTSTTPEVKNKKISKPSIPVTDILLPPKEILPKGTLCNGTYYADCPSGTTFICPNGAVGYCQAPKSDQQICEDSYGINSLSTGEKNSNGGPVCGCKAGSFWNSSQNTCEYKTDQQICQDKYGANSQYNKKNSEGKLICGCQSGYEWNNTQTSCVAIQPPISSSSYDYSYSGLGRNKGVVVFSPSGCDYYLVETSLGYSLLEWYGGFYQYEGDTIFGNLNSYGFKDVTKLDGRSGRVYIEDYMLSKSRAIEKYYDKCD